MSLRPSNRSKRILHIVAIAIALPATLAGVLDWQTINAARVIALVVVATYGAGFLGALGGISRSATSLIVGVAALGIELIAAVLCFGADAMFWPAAAVCALIVTILVGIPGTLVGWTVGYRLRPERAPVTPSAPISRPRVPRPRATISPRPPPPARDEPSLDSLPDSTRPLIFAVRLRRRMFERGRSSL